MREGPQPILSIRVCKICVVDAVWQVRYCADVPVSSRAIFYYFEYPELSIMNRNDSNTATSGLSGTRRNAILPSVGLGVDFLAELAGESQRILV